MCLSDPARPLADVEAASELDVKLSMAGPASTSFDVSRGASQRSSSSAHSRVGSSDAQEGDNREYEGGHWHFAMEGHQVSQLLAASRIPPDHKTSRSSESCFEDYFTASSVTPVPSDTDGISSDQRVRTDLVSSWLSLTTGLDGPISVGRSSAESSRWSVAVTSSSGSSIKFSPNSSRPNFNQSATINWAVSLPRRKPRHQHDVSEVSHSGRPSHRRVLTYTQDNHNNGDGLVHTDQFPTITPKYVYNDRREITTESCPELHDCSDEIISAFLSMSKVIGIHPLSKVPTMTNFKQKDDRRHLASRGYQQSYPKVRDLRMLRFLGRLYSGISPYTRRSEFPAPPGGKERRFLSRDSVDIFPSSGDETPICNTPDPDSLLHPHNFSTGSHLGPLAMTSAIIAARGIDQLSLRARRHESLSEVPITKPGQKRRRASRLSEVMFPRLV